MRRMSAAIGELAVVLALSVATCVPLAAQRPGRMGGQPDRAELERRVRARFGQMVQQRLGLTDDQATRLGETVQSFQEDRMRLVREEEAVRKRVEALLLEGGEDQAQARELLGRMNELHAREAQLSESEQAKLLEVLTPVQVLQFQALREEMGQRIRRLRGGGPPGSGGGPPGPGGGMEFMGFRGPER